MTRPKARMAQLSRRFEIRNRLGLHARAATVLVQTANRFSCEIRIRKGSIEVNAKSIMGVLQLAASQGQRIELWASGEQAEQAVAVLGQLIEDRFGESE